MFFFDELEYHAVFSRIDPILADTPEAEQRFLSPDEVEQWRRIRDKRARNAWLAGRICLKVLWSRSGRGAFEGDSIAWPTMNVVSRNNQGKGVRPELDIHGKRIDRHFSLSHSDLSVLVVLSKHKNRRIGCDLVPLGSFSGRSVPRHNPFIFHESEQELIQKNLHIGDYLWAVKEAVYKATSLDRPFVPLRWIVRGLKDDLFECRSADGSFIASTRLLDGHVMAVALS